MFEIMSQWGEYELREIDDVQKRASICGVSEEQVKSSVKAIMLSDNLENAAQKASAIYNRGQWPLFYFGQDGKGGIRRKTYLNTVGGRIPTNFWPFSETGHTDEAKKEMLAIFDGKATFDTPKPHRLIEFVLKVAGTKDTLILDSFAGSGTTAHAVLNMNKADGGHRKFILVEMGDYADTGGSFSYYELGEPLLLPSGNLNEKVGTEKIRDYIWYTETKKPLPDHKNSNPYFLGENNSTAYYFFYEPQKVCVLNYDFVATIPEKAEGYIIYADRCTLSEQELQQLGITFKKIPRDIVRV